MLDGKRGRMRRNCVSRVVVMSKRVVCAVHRDRLKAVVDGATSQISVLQPAAVAIIISGLEDPPSVSVSSSVQLLPVLYLILIIILVAARLLLFPQRSEIMSISICNNRGWGWEDR
jgi:hypothetical protein